MFTHDTPATLDAGPNLLKLSESAFLKEVLHCFAKGHCFAKVLASREVRPSSESPQMREQGKCPR
jgi:hypothetical protein